MRTFTIGADNVSDVTQAHRLLHGQETDVFADAGYQGVDKHPFRVLKCQFGYRKTPYRGLAKNGAQLNVLFALVNLWLARKALLAATG